MSIVTWCYQRKKQRVQRRGKLPAVGQQFLNRAVRVVALKATTAYFGNFSEEITLFGHGQILALCFLLAEYQRIGCHFGITDPVVVNFGSQIQCCPERFGRSLVFTGNIIGRAVRR